MAVLAAAAVLELVDQMLLAPATLHLRPHRKATAEEMDQARFGTVLVAVVVQVLSVALVLERMLALAEMEQHHLFRVHLCLMQVAAVVLDMVLAAAVEMLLTAPEEQAAAVLVVALLLELLEQQIQAVAAVVVDIVEPHTAVAPAAPAS
tara:strand:- start:36 stop:482 length:447 start_codon:yes stop_codon:yes gene_type:complete